MAWSDAARAAAALARKRRAAMYTPGGGKYHVGRSVMAAQLREARGIGMRGPGKSLAATKFATGVMQKVPGDGGGETRPRMYTSVKGAQFADQGLKGYVWNKATKSWKATPGQVSLMRARNRLGMKRS